jgi:hypothetical protein
MRDLQTKKLWNWKGVLNEILKELMSDESIMNEVLNEVKVQEK